MSSRARAVFVAVVAIALIVPVAALASDRFTDVPDSNVFHDDISWLADAKVTLGCNPPANDEFCPNEKVSRQQMAAFMRRLASNQVVDAATAIDAENAENAENAAALDGYTVDELVRSEYAERDGSDPSVTTGTLISLSIEAPVAGNLLVSGQSLVVGSGVVDLYVCSVAVDDIDPGNPAPDLLLGSLGAGLEGGTDSGGDTDSGFILDTCTTQGAVAVSAGTYDVSIQVGSGSGLAEFDVSTLTAEFIPFAGDGAAVLASPATGESRTLAEIIADLSAKAGID
jgi:hypothetical protein